MNSSICRKTDKTLRLLRAGGGTALRYLTTGLAVLILVGCGLEVVAFLEPPLSDTITDFPPLAVVEFQHNYAVNQDGPGVVFLGYEVYYRFYDGSDDGALFDTHRGQVEASPVVLGPSRLTTRNYRSLQALTVPQGIVQQSPLLPIASAVQGSPVKVDLRFEDVAAPDFPPEVVQSGDAAARIPITTGIDPDYQFLRLRRSVTTTETAGFFPLDTENYVLGDHLDLGAVQQNLQQLLDNQDLAIGLFILAYGIDPLSLRVIYSEPRKLLYQRLSDAE